MGRDGGWVVWVGMGCNGGVGLDRPCRMHWPNFFQSFP